MNLLPLVARGDLDALAACKSRYELIVAEIAARFSQPRLSALALSRVLDAAKEFDPRACDEAVFVAMVAVRAIRQLARASGSRARAVPETDLAITEATLLTFPSVQCALGALATATHTELDVMVLRVCYGLSQREVAAELQISVTDVVRARRKVVAAVCAAWTAAGSAAIRGRVKRKLLAEAALLIAHLDVSYARTVPNLQQRADMAQLHRLPCRDEDGNVHVVVEAPRGSVVKLKYEPALDAIVASRSLPAGIAYPFDWGFVPSTTAEDGDPLDAMIIADYGMWPGVVVPSRVVGVVRVSQRSKLTSRPERNDRIIAVPESDDRHDDVRDLGQRMRADLEKFFLVVGGQTHAHIRVEGWDGKKKAMALLGAAAKTYTRGH